MKRVSENDAGLRDRESVPHMSVARLPIRCPFCGEARRHPYAASCCINSCGASRAWQKGPGTTILMKP